MTKIKGVKGYTQLKVENLAQRLAVADMLPDTAGVVLYLNSAGEILLADFATSISRNFSIFTDEKPNLNHQSKEEVSAIAYKKMEHKLAADTVDRYDKEGKTKLIYWNVPNQRYKD